MKVPLLMAFSKLVQSYLFLLLASFPQLSTTESIDSVPEQVMEIIGEVAESVEEGVSCHSPLDIILALDASGSVLRENWVKTVNFTEKLAENLLALNAASRMGVIDFSQVANEAIQPTSDWAVLSQELENLKKSYQNGITRTELALNKASEMLNAINREAAKKVLLVVTDGQTTPLNGMVGLDLLKTPTENLKAAGVHVTAVGVGTQVNDQELNFMATDPDDETVFHIDNYDNLLNLVYTLSRAVCQDDTTEVVPTQPPLSLAPTSYTDPSAVSTCPVVYTKIGCLKDDMNLPRPLPELLLTDRDRTSKKYSNISIGWTNWNSYMKELVCRCAKEAKVRNYPYFSIQYYGECWSGPEAEDTYNRAGVVDTCKTYDYAKCDPSDSKECVGEQKTNFVYGVELPVAEPACKVKYHKLGCYKDNQKNPRPLPKLLQTDRDPKSAVYSTIKIDWGKWDSYISDLVCRCAEKAAENNYHYFGLQYFGECWSGADDEIQYEKIGRKDDKCVTRGYKTCAADPKATDVECVGTQRANYVYGITKIRDASCSVPFQFVNCYKDRQKKGGRPLPELLFTDRDKKSKVYSGVPINWGKWDTYINDLACRCSKAAKEKRYSHFGIQHYGECWSGPEAGGTFSVDGSSDACVGKKFEKCQPSETCVGKSKANAVYSV